MTSHSALPRRSSPYGWMAVLMIATAFVWWDSIVRSRHTLEVTESYGVTVDPPAVDAGSATGYEDGRRSMVLPSAGADTAHWLMQTQAMIAEGNWRVRKVSYDNAPAGREVHWASPFHWWLAALAWIDHAISDRPWGIAVERASLTSGPVMLTLVFVGLLPFLNRRFSFSSAVITALGMVAVYPFYLDFLPGRADHHGLANICGMLTVLFLVVGSAPAESGAMVDPKNPRQAIARKWFVASAVAGGIGLWISAATQIPVLIGVGLGAIAAAWFGRESSGGIPWIENPGLFRIWGLVGGGVSLLTYFIEYFPSNFGFRLEVNHPLYALAWFGAGELLRSAILFFSRKQPVVRRDAVGAWIGAALVMVVPLNIIFTGSKNFAVTDPFTWKLHSLHISEFQGLARYFFAKGLNWGVVALALPVVLVVPALICLLRGSVSRMIKLQLVFALLPALLGWMMGWSQIRWLGLAFALSVPVMALCFRELERMISVTRRIRMLWLVGGVTIFLPGAIVAVQRTLAAPEFTQEEIRSLAERDVGHWLRQRTKGENVVVAGSPSPTTRLIYFGGLSGLGTLYWENKEGLKKSAALFAASSSEEAYQLAQRYGVTHIVLFSWDAFEIAQAKLYRNLEEDAAIPADLFVAQLLSAPVPPAWLRAIPFVLPESPAIVGEQVRIWEVVAPQTPATAAAHSANYYLEMGLQQAAVKLIPALAEHREDLQATLMEAAIIARQENNAAFAGIFNRVIQQLPQSQVMQLDDRVALIVVLTVGDRADLARQQLQLAMAKIDERGLRNLTVGMLSDLLALSEALRVDFPDDRLKDLAQKLLPPAKRQH